MHTSIRTSGQLGPLLKKLRKAKKWSQSELGRRIALSQERISAIENHPEKVTLDNLLTVMMALNAEFIVASNTDSGKDLSSEASSTQAQGSKPKEPW